VNQPPSFSAGPNQSVLEDDGAKSVGAWATAISPGPASESTQTVTFTATADNTSLFAVQPAVSPTGTLSYTPAADAFGVATVTVTARDDGGTANGGMDTSAPVTFTITIDPVNDIPGFNAGANQSVLEDSPTQSVNGWATAMSVGPPNESSQILNFDVVADNPALFSIQPSVNPTGKLSFKPAPDASGVATVRIHVHDNGGTANGGVDETPEQTFTITIAPVNDAPSFTAGSDQTVVSLLGNVTVPGWATNILAGPANESSQTLQFLVTNNNPGLFATQPAVAPNGTLTFQTTALALGVATVTVRLQDNGGTLNGGVDTSPPQTFTITVI
jgi:large repetitive protein